MSKKIPLVPYYQEPPIKKHKSKKARPQSSVSKPAVSIDATLDLNSLFYSFMQQYGEAVERRVLAEVLLMAHTKDGTVTLDSIEVPYREDDSVGR